MDDPHSVAMPSLSDLTNLFFPDGPTPDQEDALLEIASAFEALEQRIVELEDRIDELR
ncbi:Uncharacterised protein [Mycobacteroides abscessus subsp. massiliense]|uniref:hypothetical protein n=1 Tax=Mycobacteroides abscessus TaxID=36809 RepID=UPI0009D25BB5|nr:hypothetical protein [Mycobacteroides abscessus]SKS09768.1 Uncharacterised protein [Mycobacteroides abscessus subsp. massiliense]